MIGCFIIFQDAEGNDLPNATLQVSTRQGLGHRLALVRTHAPATAATYRMHYATPTGSMASSWPCARKAETFNLRSKAQ